MKSGTILTLFATSIFAVLATNSLVYAQPLPDRGIVAPTNDTADRIMRTMGLHRFAVLLAEEIKASGDPLAFVAPNEGTPAAADPEWIRIVERIAPVRRIQLELYAGVAKGISQLDPKARAEVAHALSFWESPEGRRALALEFAAREMLLSPDAEATARSDFAKAAALNDPRVALVRKLIETADLIEPGVAASLNMVMASLEGINDVLALPEGVLVGDVWELEPEIRADQAGWMEALIFVSTSPMSLSEMERLSAHAASPGAKRLNNLIGEAANELFSDIARELGRAAATRSTASRL